MQVPVEFGVIRPRQLNQIDPVQTQVKESAVTVTAPQPELTLPTVQPQVNQNLSDVNQPFSIHTKLSVLIDLYLKDKEGENGEQYDMTNFSRSAAKLEEFFKTAANKISQWRCLRINHFLSTWK